MSTEFALDLKVARRKAGLTQRDIATLMGISRKRMSQLERGKTLPTLYQICALSLIFGRSFESLFASVMDSTRIGIKVRLGEIPDKVRESVETFNRASSLRRLQDRLKGSEVAYGGA